MPYFNNGCYVKQKKFTSSHLTRIIKLAY